MSEVTTQAKPERRKRQKLEDMEGYKPSIYGLTRDELIDWAMEHGEKKFRATQIWDWLYKKRVQSFEEMTNISKDFIAKLNENFCVNPLKQRIVQESKDGTVKYLFELPDGMLIETVLMRQHYGLSVCVTTQVGCNIGCTIIEVRPIDGQVDDIIDEIHQRIEKNERVLITTLTKRMAEDLSAYLVELGLKVAYLHSDTKTLERTEILRDLRLGKYDVLVGINLLREGLDLPEVSLVCILDADKEGFLRSERSLIQTIGRAARNSHGKVIMYGDKITDSMQKAIDETARRREIQEKYNKEHGIIPQTIKKEIREAIHGQENVDEAISLVKKGKKAKKKDKETLIKELEKQMKEAAKALDFERAMELRDMMLELQGEV